MNIVATKLILLYLILFLVAEINIHNETFTICKSIPDDLVIFNVNEVNDLIMASHCLVKLPLDWIRDNYIQTLFYEQPFLEALSIDKHIFGCVKSLQKIPLQSQYQIILALCDTHTQSNFLWNDKPLTVTTKALNCDANYMASKMTYQQIYLQPMNDSSDEPGGIRFGDRILYNGPFDVIFD